MESSDRQNAATNSFLPSSETAEIIPRVTADAFAKPMPGFDSPCGMGPVNSQSSPGKGVCWALPGEKEKERDKASVSLNNIFSCKVTCRKMKCHQFLLQTVGKHPG